MKNLSEFEDEADSYLAQAKSWWKSLKPQVKAVVAGVAVVIVLVVLRWVF